MNDLNFEGTWLTRDGEVITVVKRIAGDNLDLYPWIGESVPGMFDVEGNCLAPYGRSKDLVERLSNRAGKMK